MEPFDTLLGKLIKSLPVTPKLKASIAIVIIACSLALGVWFKFASHQWPY